ncbi:MAG: hypothetical protein V1869_01435 [Candidatus Omnitrophota bacterium]
MHNQRLLFRLLSFGLPRVYTQGAFGPVVSGRLFNRQQYRTCLAEASLREKVQLPVAKA